jgi:hypothetical protein
MNCSLAMAEMTALVVAIYREYTTSIATGFEDKSPAITSRFELFYDETVPEIVVSTSHCEKSSKVLTILQEHTCLIKFTKVS